MTSPFHIVNPDAVPEQQLRAILRFLERAPEPVRQMFRDILESGGAPDVPLAVALRAYEAHLHVRQAAGQLSEATEDKYRLILRHLRRWVREHVGRRAMLGTVTHAVVDAYLGDRGASGRLHHRRGGRTVRDPASATLRLRISVVRGFFRWCGEAYRLPANPVTYTRGSCRIPSRLRPFLTAQGVRHLLGLALRSRYPLRNRAMVAVMVGTGIRIGGLVGLTVGDARLSSADASLTVKLKGGGTSVKPLIPELVPVLDDWLRHGLQPRVGVLRPEAPLFCSMRGKPEALSHWSARETIETLLGRLGPDDVDYPGSITERLTPHTLRRTFATHLLLQGVKPSLIQLLLDHRHMETTSRYLQLRLRDVRTAMEGAIPFRHMLREALVRMEARHP